MLNNYVLFQFKAQDNLAFFFNVFEYFVSLNIFSSFYLKKTCLKSKINMLILIL